jgi:Zn-dependent protease with chaperone function
MGLRHYGRVHRIRTHAGFALTPVGEGLFRFINGCRRPTHAEEDKLRPVFEVVCKSAGADPNSYGLFVSDDKFPNAFAMGWRTVCVTRSLLMNFPDHALAGILAHEMGHHAKRDALCSIIFYMITIVGQILMWGGWVVSRILAFLPRVAGREGSREREYAGIFTIFSWMATLLLWFFQLFVWVPIFIGSCFGSRQKEYRADLYAARIGYRDELLSALNVLLDVDGHPSGFMGILYRTHPKTGERIRRLEDYEEAAEPERESPRLSVPYPDALPDGDFEDEREETIEGEGIPPVLGRFRPAGALTGFSAALKGLAGRWGKKQP